jgi:uncharacterized protein (TIGR02145 family)
MKQIFIWVILTSFTMISFQRCSGEEDPEITEPLEIVLTSHDVTTFRGSDGSVTTEVTGGVSPYNYLWSNGATTRDLAELVAGEYSVIVKDAVDSTAMDTVVINQPIPENTVFDVQENMYPTVKIGTQTWMQQNLRVKVAPDGSPITSYVYNNDEENAKTYGRLYPWDAAMNGSIVEGAQGLCPTGWHVPSDNEWKILEMYLGMTQAEADLVNMWRGQGVGTKMGKGGDSGYEALYSGKRDPGGAFNLKDQWEYMWSSTEAGTSAWRRCLSSTATTVGRYDTFTKAYGFSVRCVKDE